MAAFLIDAANSSKYRSNLIKSITKLFDEGGAVLDVIIDFYQKDPALFGKLTGLKGKTFAEVKKELKRIFSGTEFNAHHIVPANLLYNNPVLQDILKWAAENGKIFDFNDMDNLVFLRLVNHTDGVYGHADYDKLIGKEISGLSDTFKKKPSNAFNDLNEIIKKYQDGIKDQLIGTTKKLDNLNGSQLK